MSNKGVVTKKESALKNKDRTSEKTVRKNGKVLKREHGDATD